MHGAGVDTRTTADLEIGATSAADQAVRLAMGRR
jgi:hypothetical protein